jgi:hypothetical protein
MKSGKPDLAAFHPLSVQKRWRAFLDYRAPRAALNVLMLAGFLAMRGSACAQGTFEAIQNYSTDGTTAFVNGTAGWSFAVSNYVTITALGCYTNALAGQNMALGLWGANGTLLASNLVTTLSSLAGLSRYEPVSPIFLDPGETYYVGAYSPSGTTVLETYIPGTTAPLLVAPEIEIGGLAASTNSGFAFPVGQPGTGGDVYLGVNFQFHDGVPEPSVVSIFGLAACMLAARGRRLLR